MKCTVRLAVVLLGLLVLVCLAWDFLMVPFLAMAPARPIPGVPILLAMVGCVLAQGCLLAAWLAWSDQPFWPRLRRHWIIAAILYLVWAAGLAISRPSEFAAASAFVGLSVPLVALPFCFSWTTWAHGLTGDLSGKGDFSGKWPDNVFRIACCSGTPARFFHSWGSRCVSYSSSLPSA